MVRYSLLLIMAVGGGVLAADAPGNTSPPRDAAEERFRQWDENGDGKLTRDELPTRVRAKFNRVDSNHDGTISLDEHRAKWIDTGSRSRREEDDAPANTTSLRPPDFPAPKGEHVSATGKPLPDKLYSQLNTIFKEASQVWPDLKKKTPITSQEVETMVKLLSDERLVGDGLHCEAGYKSMGMHGFGWGLSIYGHRPAKDTKVIMRVYPEGKGLTYESLTKTYGEPRLTKSAGDMRHVIYGHVDVIFHGKQKYIGTIFFFDRSCSAQPEKPVLHEHTAQAADQRTSKSSVGRSTLAAGLGEAMVVGPWELTVVSVKKVASYSYTGGPSPTTITPKSKTDKIALVEIKGKLKRAPTAQEQAGLKKYLSSFNASGGLWKLASVLSKAYKSKGFLFNGMFALTTMEGPREIKVGMCAALESRHGLAMSTTFNADGTPSACFGFLTGEEFGAMLVVPCRAKEDPCLLLFFPFGDAQNAGAALIDTRGPNGLSVRYGTVATLAKTGPSGDKKETVEEDPKPEPEAQKGPDKPAPPPGTAASTPEQECRKWFQMARNYLLAGQKKIAKTYLQKILDKYPDTPWAQQAQEQMKQTQ